MAPVRSSEKRKRTYAEYLHGCKESQECTSPERKRRKICRGRSLRKRPYSEVSQGSDRAQEVPSPERKRMRMTTNAEEKDTERPSTSEDPSPVVQVPVQERTERDSMSQAFSNSMLPKKTRKGDRTERVTKIWIIGSSYIHRGEQAACEMFGENFGLPGAKVDWFGQGGMRWRGVLPRFYCELATQSPPDILVVHAGGNNLGTMYAKDLAQVMQRELMQLHEEFPSMKIAFSCINERQSWRVGWPGKVNNDRKYINKLMKKAAGNFGGEVIKHPFLKFYNQRLYLPDGVHFTKVGNGIFLSSIRDALQKMLQAFTM